MQDPLGNTEIGRSRRAVFDGMLVSGMKPNFTSLSRNDLERLYRLYDDVFFGGQISAKLRSLGENTTLDFDVTSSATAKYGGVCKTQYRPLAPGKKPLPTDIVQNRSCHYTLAFPSVLYAGLFTKGETRLANAGTTCDSRLLCLMLTFEHELTHLLMGMYGYDQKYQNSKVVSKLASKYGGFAAPKTELKYSAHGPLFRCFLTTVFGHTEFKHGLLNGEFDEEAAERTVNDFSVGDWVLVKGLEGAHRITQKKIKFLVVVHPGTGKMYNAKPSIATKTDAPVGSATPTPARSPSKFGSGIGGFGFVAPAGSVVPPFTFTPAIFTVGDIVTVPNNPTRFELLQKRVTKWSAKNLTTGQIVVGNFSYPGVTKVGRGETKVATNRDFQRGDKVRYNGREFSVVGPKGKKVVIGELSTGKEFVAEASWLEKIGL